MDPHLQPSPMPHRHRRPPTHDPRQQPPRALQLAAELAALDELDAESDPEALSELELTDELCELCCELVELDELLDAELELLNTDELLDAELELSFEELFELDEDSELDE